MSTKDEVLSALAQKDARIKELREALEQAAKIVNGVHAGTLPQCFRPSLEVLNDINRALSKED